jgi:predicted nucleotidyltransferase
MHIEKRHFKIVQSILKKYAYTFYAFGSRVTGKNKKLSDLDLVYFETISYQELAHLEEDFEESDLPFTVDIVNWNKCEVAFQKKIIQNLEYIQGSKPFPTHS